MKHGLISRGCDGQGNGLYLLDVSAPPTVSLIAHWEEAVYDVSVRDGMAYLTGASFQIVDFSDPQSPTIHGSLAGGQHIIMDDNVAYLADGSTLKVIDVQDVDHPQKIGEYMVYESGVERMTSLVSLGEFLYLVATSRWSGSTITGIDVGNPTQPVLHSRYKAGNYTGLNSGLGYLLSSRSVDREPERDLQVFELRQGQLRPRALYGLPRSHEDLAAEDGLLFVAGGAGGLQILRLNEAAFVGDYVIPHIQRD